MARAKQKYSEETCTILDAVTHGMGILQCLRDEVQEIVDNAPVGLQDSARISTLRESVEALDGYCDDEPDALAEGVDREIVVRTLLPLRKGRGLSRNSQLANALIYLNCAVDSVNEEIEALETVVKQKQDDKEDDAESDEAQIEALQEYVTEIENVIEGVEGCEFPGMFG